MKIILKTIILLIFIINSESSFSQKNQLKKIIGEKATVEIKEGKINFLGRVDTGAKTTSINTKNIKKEGDFVKFTILNKQGQSFSMRTEIADERVVFNAGGKEKRFFVYLTLEYKGISRKILVNLNNRSKSTYKILLGRNWLKGKYIVDVSLK